MIVEIPGTPRFDGCASWRDGIESRFDDALPPNAIGAVERHVASCPGCRAYEAALKEIRRGLRDLPGVSPDLPSLDVLEAVWAVTIGAGARTGARFAGERRIGAGAGSAEMRRGEPRRAEPRRTETSPAEPSPAEPSPAEPSPAELRRTDPSPAEPWPPGAYPAPVRRASVWAAVAVLTLAASAAFVLHRASDPGPSAYTEAELAQLDRDLETALATIGHTFRSAEQFAVNEVLIGETAPALRQLPVSPENE